MADDQVYEMLLRYVKPSELNEKVTEFRKKIIELGREMQMPSDIIEELELVCKLYE